MARAHVPVIGRVQIAMSVRQASTAPTASSSATVRTVLAAKVSAATVLAPVPTDMLETTAAFASLTVTAPIVRVNAHA